jgi:hypothetical protein
MNSNKPANANANSLNAIANRTLATLTGTRKNNTATMNKVNNMVTMNTMNKGNNGAASTGNAVAPMMSANHTAGKYNVPAKGIKEWYKSEMDAVGHLAAMHDEHLRRMYASKVVDGMKHLVKAIDEKINDDGYQNHHRDFELMKQAVLNAMEHVKKDYDVTEDNITYKWNTMMGGKRRASRRARRSSRRSSRQRKY